MSSRAKSRDLTNAEYVTQVGEVLRLALRMTSLASIVRVVNEYHSTNYFISRYAALSGGISAMGIPLSLK